MLHESMLKINLAAEDFISIFLPVVFGYVASCFALIFFKWIKTDEWHYHGLSLLFTFLYKRLFRTGLLQRYDEGHGGAPYKLNSLWKIQHYLL